MSRWTLEWCGKTDNTPVPQRVRLRVFERDCGMCCNCQRVIVSGVRWSCDHKKALINGGQNREKNLQTLCWWCHDKIKTPADVKEKSDTYHTKSYHLGLKKPKGRPMPGTRASGIRKRMSGKVERWK